MSGAINLFNTSWSAGCGVSSAGYGNAITAQEQFPDFPYDIAAATLPVTFLHFDGIGKMLFSIFL